MPRQLIVIVCCIALSACVNDPPKVADPADSGVSDTGSDSLDSGMDAAQDMPVDSAVDVDRDGSVDAAPDLPPMVLDGPVVPDEETSTVRAFEREANDSVTCRSGQWVTRVLIRSTAGDTSDRYNVGIGVECTDVSVVENVLTPDDSNRTPEGVVTTAWSSETADRALACDEGLVSGLALITFGDPNDNNIVREMAVGCSTLSPESTPEVLTVGPTSYEGDFHRSGDCAEVAPTVMPAASCERTNIECPDGSAAVGVAAYRNNAVFEDIHLICSKLTRP